MDEIIYYWQACCDVQPDHRISAMAMHHLLYRIYNLQASGGTERGNIKETCWLIVCIIGVDVYSILLMH